MWGGDGGLAFQIGRNERRKLTAYGAPHQNRRKRRPRNEAVARRVKARSEGSPKSARHWRDELEVGQRRRCKVRGKFPHSVPFALMGSSGTMAVRRIHRRAWPKAKGFPAG